MILHILTFIYLLCAVLIALYTAGQVILLAAYWRYHHHKPPLPEIQDFPSVTIQLPIYNEYHVVTRLLDAAASLDYPRDRLAVQVLDDSTDETTSLVAKHAARLREAGLNIVHVRRESRQGYKAGALAYGLTLTDSEVVAVFDADFVPPPDFLRRTVPYMAADARLGIVQTRWGHLNPFDNLLTRAQTLLMDAHFVIEQPARNRAGWLLTFNGTGGLWRRRCIEDAGGWSADTLTEDLDLSYRAQMAGWKMLYLPDVVVPGQLPPQLQAYKQQQARWAKGNTQCLLRLFGRVWHGSLTLPQRLMAMQHLCQYLPHPLMMILLLLTPLLAANRALSTLPLAPLGLVGLAPPLIYAVSQRMLYSDWKTRMLVFPVVMVLGTGIAWNNTRAVLGALAGKGGVFHRTPKFDSEWQLSQYALSADGLFWQEIVLAAYMLGGALVALRMQPSVAPYLLFSALAFGGVALWGWWDRWQMRHPLKSPAHTVSPM